MSKNAYFEVGELVVVSCSSRPELNGDAIVLGGPFCQDDKAKCPHCGSEVLVGKTDQPNYYLSIVDYDCCATFNQSVMRKKHKPSDLSFSELLTKDNETAGVK